MGQKFSAYGRASRADDSKSGSRAACIYSFVFGHSFQERLERRSRSFLIPKKRAMQKVHHKALLTAMRSWKKIWRHLENVARTPKLIKQASQHALNRWRRARRLRSYRYALASTPGPQSHSQAAFRKRENYMHRLGIPRRSKNFMRRKASKDKGAVQEDSEDLELVVEEVTHRTSSSETPQLGKMQRDWSTPSMQRAASVGALPPASQLMQKCVSTSTLPHRLPSPDTPSEAPHSADVQQRMKFLQKLSYERVWVPKVSRPPSHQTVIIFDWDDTLLCTSFLKQCMGTALPLDMVFILKEIEKSASVLLEQSLSLGHTFIITNAVSGWVEQSAFEHFPELLPVLERVHVVSARSKYEAEFPNKPAAWKRKAFLDIQKQLGSEVIANLVSLGDSCFEMEAALAMGKEFDQAVVKTIKFLSSPSPESLARQLDLVSRQFETIISTARNLRVRMKPPDSLKPSEPLRRSQPQATDNTSTQRSEGKG